MKKETKITEYDKDKLRYAILETFTHHHKRDFEDVEKEIVAMANSIKKEVLEVSWKEEGSPQ